LNFYKIKDLAKQLSSQLLDCFAIKGGEKNVSFSLSYGGKFADLKFLNSHISEICGFLILN
jgi:hypothetical protein